MAKKKTQSQSTKSNGDANLGDAALGDPAFVSIPTAAKYLSVSTPTVRRFLTQKRLRRFKCGSRTLLLFDEVKGLVQEAK